MLTFSAHFNYSNYCITWPWLCPALSACCPVKSELFATGGSLTRWFQALGPACDGLWEARLPSLVAPAAGALAGRPFPSFGDSCSCQPLAQGHAPLGQPLASAWCLGVGVEQGSNSEAPELPAVGQAAGCPRLASQLSASLPAQVLTPRAFLTNILHAVLPFRACFLGRQPATWPTERGKAGENYSQIKKEALIEV